MKKYITGFLVITIFTLSAGLMASAKYSESTGFEGEYLAHTTLKAIEFKKKDALEWFENNVDKKKFYYLGFTSPQSHTATNEIAFMKKEAFEWYENNVDKSKFYHINKHKADKEIALKKDRALKWYERNSQI